MTLCVLQVIATSMLVSMYPTHVPSTSTRGEESRAQAKGDIIGAMDAPVMLAEHRKTLPWMKKLRLFRWEGLRREEGQASMDTVREEKGDLPTTSP